MAPPLSRCSTRSAGSVRRILLGSEPWTGVFELEPHVGRPLVDPPTARLGVDDRQPPATYALEVALAHDPLESRTLVDDLDEEAILVEVRPQRDLAASVHHGVRDELGDEQLGCPELIALDISGEPTGH